MVDLLGVVGETFTNILKSLNEQITVSEWIDSHLRIEFKFSDENERYSFACFDIAIEHHSAILRLCDQRLYGSAFSLLRVEFEAVVRGLWLKCSASENDIEKFANDEVKPSFKQLIAAVENDRGISSGILSFLGEKQWRLFNSLTHTGREAIFRRIGQATTGHDNYREEDIIKCLSLSGLVAIFAAFELCILTGNEVLTKQLAELAEKYKNHQL